MTEPPSSSATTADSAERDAADDVGLPLAERPPSEAEPSSIETAKARHQFLPRERERPARLVDHVPWILTGCGALSLTGAMLLALNEPTPMGAPAAGTPLPRTTVASDVTERGGDRGVGIDHAAIGAALDDVAQQATAAGGRVRALEERAMRAERVVRLRLLQKQIALARDARRSAGQTGAALKGPFPPDELGPLDALELSKQRWLVTREGELVAPASASPLPVQPSSIASATRDEDVASLPASIDGAAVVLERLCVPFEPWCLVDVRDATPAPIEPAVDVRSLRAALAAPHGFASGAAPSTTPATSRSTSTSTSSPPTEPEPRRPLVGILLALIGVGGVLGVAWYLRRLGSDLVALASTLRAGWRSQGRVERRDGAGPATLPELASLQQAFEERIDDLERVGAQEVSAEWRRERLSAVVSTLEAARRQGGVKRLTSDDRDDALLARVIVALNALLETLDARHRRVAMAITEVEGTLRLVTPLSQRLLRLARVDGLPSAAVDELTSLGSSLGQRARRPQVIPPLMQDLAPLVSPTSSVVDIAAAVAPLGDDGARLAARQLEGVAREGSTPPSTTSGAISTDESTPPPDRP
jgi:hypothetical protein